MIGSGALLIASTYSERIKHQSEYTQQELEQMDQKKKWINSTPRGFVL